jgi:riboflavin kinase / FMN adenylyltransferase
MIVYRSSEEMSKTFPKPVVAVGNFDGVHLGHRELFKQVCHKSRELSGTAMIYTFHPHPSEVLKPEAAQPQINTLDERLMFMERLGIDVAIIETFNRDFSEMSAQKFLVDIIQSRVRPAVIYVGFNFSFGKNREGNVEILKAFCKSAKIECNIVPPLKIDDKEVSSSRIRSLIQQGNMKEASNLLGRNYFLKGIVVKGVERGKKLGIPTANLSTPSKLVPKMGVYATWVEMNNDFFPSVTNVGHSPTFDDKSTHLIETHLLNFNKDLYGQTITVHFEERLRDTQKFPSAEALVTQIRKDIAQAQRLLKT